MNTKIRVTITGFVGIVIAIAFWRLIVMPYQQGAYFKECIRRPLASETFNLDYFKLAVDVCSAGAVYPRLFSDGMLW